MQGKGGGGEGRECPLKYNPGYACATPVTFDKNGEGGWKGKEGEGKGESAP